MLIRNSQVKAMHDAMADEYLRRLMKFYHSRVPQLVSRFSDVELHGRISTAVSKARSLGLISADSIVQYVGLALAAGPEFNDNPKVQQLMTMPGSPPELKLRRLLQLVGSNLYRSGTRGGFPTSDESAEQDG
jgi:hypothetical protein